MISPKMVSEPKKLIWAFLLIVAVNLIAYFPSFFHIPRSDQVAYLADMADKEDWGALAIQSYDFTRTRRFCAGDELLFKPIAYFVLGTEKFLFGYEFIYWQIFNFLLHCGFLFLLLKILTTIQPGIFAALLTAYFSVLPTGMEMVIWQHVNFYLYSLILLSVCLICILENKDSETIPLKTYGVMSLCLLVGCFSAEVMNVFSLVIFGYLFVTKPKSKENVAKHLLLIIPTILFVAINFFLLERHGFAAVSENPLLRGASFLSTVLGTMGHTLTAFLRWLSYRLFPGQFDVLIGGRTTLETIETLNPVTLVSVFVIVVYAVIALQANQLTRSKKKKRFNVLLFALMLAFCLMLAFTRFNVRGLSYLKDSLYFVYVFWGFMILFIYATIDFEKLARLRYVYLMKKIVILALTVLTIFNGGKVFAITLKEARRSLSTRVLLGSVQQLVREHKDEKDFSFAVPPDFTGNYPLGFLVKKGDAPDKKYSLVEALYWKYFSEENPRYVITASSEGPIFIPAQQ